MGTPRFESVIGPKPGKPTVIDLCKRIDAFLFQGAYSFDLWFLKRAVHLPRLGVL